MLIWVKNLIEAQRKFTRMHEMLEKIKNGNKITVDEDTFFGNFNSAILDIYSAISVLKKSSTTFNEILMLDSFLPTLDQEYRSLRKKEEQNLADYEEITGKFANVLRPITTTQELGYMSSYKLNGDNFYEDWACSSYLLSDNVINEITSMIKRSSPFNVIDVSCRLGQTLSSIQKKLPMANLYGVSALQSVNIPKEERAKFKRLIVGGIGEANISTDSFDMAIVIPEISFYDESEKSKMAVNLEKKYLDRGLGSLRHNGLLVLAIPIACISKSIATSIAKILGNVRIIIENSKPDVAIIVGIKRPPLARSLDQKLFKRLRNLILHPELANMDKEFSYQLPIGTVEISRFRSAKLDDNEIELLFEESGIMNEFWKKQKVDKLSDRSAHPLLPFNVGQLGLVLTSGCLDGVIDEGNGCSHAVKGRVIKVTDSDRNISDDGSQVEVSSTTSNRVEISMFLPDGTYKYLA
jgi:hypothetical protein